MGPSPLRATEIQDRARALSQVVVAASMGPSSGGDGNVSSSRGSNDQRFASMGPSSGGDGNVSSSRGSNDQRFASMGPSSGDDGNLSVMGLKADAGETLQWGRRLVTTEMDEARPADRHLDAGASMGPSSGDDGNLKLVRERLQCWALQWGRRLVTTEMMPPGFRPRATISCFNGAVVW